MALDFALSISSATRRGIIHATNAVSAIANGVQNTRQGWDDANRGLSRNNPVLETSRNLVGSIFGQIQSAAIKTALWSGAILSVKEAIDSVIASGEKLDNLLQKNMIAFNGYQNSLNAYSKFQNDIISGKLRGSAEQYLSAATTFSKIGVKMTDDLTLRINDWAAASGKNANEVANDLSSAAQGNKGALVDYGITERTMKQFQRYTAGTTQMRDAVLSFVKAQSQFNGIAKEAPLTWANISDRMRAMKNKFFEAIAGRQNDPNSLNAMVKKTVNDALTFLNKNSETFKALAGLISASLKWIWKQISHFVEFIVQKGQQSIDSLQSYMTNWRERVAGFILYLELVKLGITRFYERNKEVINGIIKYYLIFKVAKKALNIGDGIITSVKNYGKAFVDTAKKIKNSNFAKGIVSGLESTYLFIQYRILPALARWRGGQMAVNAISLLNPYVQAVVAIAAIAAAVYLVWKHWDKIKSTVSSIPAWMTAIIGYLNPMIGLVLFLVRNWNEIKVIVTNIGITIANCAIILYYGMKNALIKTAKFFVSTAKAIWNSLPSWLKDFGGFIWNSLLAIGAKLYSFFDFIIPKWLKDAVNWLLGTDQNSMMKQLAAGSTTITQYTSNAAKELNNGKGGINAVTLDDKGGLMQLKNATPNTPNNIAPTFKPVEIKTTTKSEVVKEPPKTSYIKDVHININGDRNPEIIKQAVKDALSDLGRANSRKGYVS